MTVEGEFQDSGSMMGIFGPVDHGSFFIDHDGKILGSREGLPWHEPRENSS